MQLGYLKTLMFSTKLSIFELRPAEFDPRMENLTWFGFNFRLFFAPLTAPCFVDFILLGGVSPVSYWSPLEHCLK